MSLYVLGTISPLLVERFSGFDLPPFISRVMLLSDSGPGPHEVLQGSGTPFRTATITGLLDDTDIVRMRGYDESKEVVEFTDSNGNMAGIVIMELSTEDLGGWWTFNATIVDTGEDAGS